MRNPIVAFLVIASAATTLAVAQDGIGHGPPKASLIAAQATTSAARVALSKAFQPATELASMIK